MMRSSSRSLLTHTRSFFTVVNQGYEAYRLTLGKSPQLLKPGISWNIPLWHQVQKVDMREGPVNISELEAFTKDNVPVTIAGTLFYQVSDSYKACFSVQNYLRSITNIGTSALRSVIGLFQYDDIISDRNHINSKLKEVLMNSGNEWGIHCTKFEIQTFKPSNNAVARQLESQMEAERNRRKQVLDTEAAIVVAQGMKQKEILESEGSLQALKNKADGEFYMTERQTEAFKKQIEEVAKAFGGDVDNATKFLINLKNIDQLKAIAEGKNNSTYFMDINPFLKLINKGI